MADTTESSAWSPPGPPTLPRTARRGTPPTRASGLPPAVLGLLTGLAAAAVGYALNFVIEIPDLADWSSLARDVLYVQCFAVPLTIASAITLLFGRGARAKDVLPTALVIVGSGAVGGFVAGFVVHAWDNPSMGENRIQWAIVFIIIGVAVGAGAAVVGQAPAWIVAVTGGAGLISGLLFAQVGVSWWDIYSLVGGDSYETVANALGTLAACFPIVLGAGLAAQMANAKPPPSYGHRPAGNAAAPAHAPSMTYPAPYAAPAGAAASYSYGGPPRTNGFAIASFVLGLLGCGSLLAVIFGHVALSQIKRANGAERGRGLAITGLVLGYLGLVFGIAYLVAIAAVASNGSGY